MPIFSQEQELKWDAIAQLTNENSTLRKELSVQKDAFERTLQQTCDSFANIAEEFETLSHRLIEADDKSNHLLRHSIRTISKAHKTLRARLAEVEKERDALKDAARWVVEQTEWLVDNHNIYTGLPTDFVTDYDSNVKELARLCREE